MILHSIEPWLLARHVPNLEGVAAISLARVGFESWRPTYREFKPLPLRKIPPNRRHMAQWFVREVRVARFPGYLLIRPLPFCRYDVNDLAELRGCRSIVRIGDKAAKIQDFDVELMRLAEAKGTFDVHIGVGRRRYTITPENQLTHKPRAKFPSAFALSPSAVWHGHAIRNQKIDETGQIGLFVDALGRIARLVAQVEGEETSLSAQGVVSR